jgi:F-type H+-transporting ATPase subunit delta
VAERATIARPYAKAAFETAREAGALAAWAEGLRTAAEIVLDPRVTELVKNPELPAATVADFVIGVGAAKLDDRMKNLLRVLAENHRLPLLPEIVAHYESLKAQVENTVDVELISAVKLDPAEIEKMTAALKERLKRRINMHNSVDASLLGGAVIHAGDLVIDGSVRGRLERLRTELTG